MENSRKGPRAGSREILVSKMKDGNDRQKGEEKQCVRRGSSTFTRPREDDGRGEKGRSRAERATGRGAGWSPKGARATNWPNWLAGEDRV